MLNQGNNSIHEDRIEALRQRVEQLKKESVDYQFNQYLDQVLRQLQFTEESIHKAERHLEQSYQLYMRRNGLKLQPAMQQPVQPAMQQVLQPQTAPIQPQPAMQPQPVMQRPIQPQPAPVQPQSTMQPQPAMQQPIQPQMPVWNQPNASAPVPPNPGAKVQSEKTLEYKFGTVVLGIVGILFILIAFVTFGLQYMSTTLQGIVFYALGIAIFAFSELFLSRRLEKFSYFLSGLGIAGLYITTILNYLYLKIFPSYVALIITLLITAFFFWLSYKKNSGMIRIICLLGCYISLIPIGDLKNLYEFAIPAIIILVLNLAGFLCPLKVRNVVIDYVQYVCTVPLVIFMGRLLYVSGLQMWPLYILVCANIVTLHLICMKNTELISYRVLYILGNVIFAGILLYVGNHEGWMIWGIVAVAAMCALFMFLYRNTKLFFAPYILAAAYALLAFLLDENDFLFLLCGLIVFVVNRLLAIFKKEFALPDAIYTMLAVWCVCLAARSDDLRMIGYVFACAILVGAFFVKQYKNYHLYTAVSFAWLFLLTERMYPLICSVLICILAAAMIGGGFMKKDKPIRIYGLCLLIFVALKLVGYDFKEAESLTRIVLFLVVGLVILGVSFLYIYLEKQQDSEKMADANSMPNANTMPVMQMMPNAGISAPEYSDKQNYQNPDGQSFQNIETQNRV